MNILALKLSDTTNFTDYTYYLSLISNERQKKIDVLKFEHKKKTSLFAELLIRYQITKDLNLSNSEVSFEYNQYGKPCIKRYTDYNFSISHSKDYIVYVSDIHPIGIDIERIKNANIGLAKRFFTPKEYSHIVSSNSLDDSFFKVWTIKEAYIKMLGMGLHKPLSSFDIFSLDCNIYNTTIEDYSISVCYSSKVANSISLTNISVEDVLHWADTI